jgi:transaldolase
MTTTTYKSPLHEMTQTTASCLWNDSASPQELAYAIEHGAVGATCNPVIAVDVVKQEWEFWKGRIQELQRRHPTASEGELAWRVIEEMAVLRAALLVPVFEAHGGRNGRLSVQTDPRAFRNGPAILDQAIVFDALAPNIIVKIPATHAGLWAIEEATARGISINATVSFSVPQALAVAAAVERGLDRRAGAGHEVSTMGPVCTIMVGRLDDWLKVIADKCRITLDPGYLEWAGVAAMKRAYALYNERGYRTRLLAAAFRNHMHWSEFIGANVVISPPHAWQVRFNASDVPVRPRMDDPVDPRIVAELTRLFPDFRRAYEPDGLSPSEFDHFGPTRRTIRQFSAACHDLERLVRDVVVADPDSELRPACAPSRSDA